MDKSEMSDKEPTTHSLKKQVEASGKALDQVREHCPWILGEPLVERTKEQDDER